jgi:signal transduction histidine kinase
MIWVLLENSIKYTDAGGKIILSVYTDNTHAYVSVKDAGCGIPEEDIPFIFDRFYRVDKSRNKNIPGTGLGLSIAQLIARKHNAKINVFSKVNEGTDMVVAIPLIKD